MEVLAETLSIDTEEYLNFRRIKPVRAQYILKGDEVYLRKENGEEEYIGEKWWWEHISKFLSRESKLEKTITEYKGCPLSCGLCNNHKNRTALLNIVVTNRCELECWYCFFHSGKAGFVYEPSLDQIAKMAEVASEANGFVPPVQLTGGEPLLREDLLEIIRELKKLGVPHIQLNTSGSILGVMAYQDMDQAIDYAKKLKKAGVNTFYISFDGTRPETNFKNHFEIPYFVKALKEAGIKSVVLVPTVIKNWNFSEIDKIVILASKHLDILRGVNFQPVSLVERLPKKEREKLRVTIPDVIVRLEHSLGIPRYSFFPPSTVAPFVKILTGESYGFENHPICGVAMYLFVENGRLIPITDFINVEAFYKITRFLDDMGRVGRTLGKLIIPASSLILAKGKLREMIYKVAVKRDYESAGEFHMHTLYVGMMHFQDYYNYDVERVQRCCIHYALPNGEIIPFCTFNVFPEKYRNPILEQYSIKDLTEQRKLEAQLEKAKRERREFRKKIDEIIKHEIYREFYKPVH